MKFGFNIWAGNTVVDYNALAGYQVWHKLIDLPNAKDQHFDDFWLKSMGIFERGIFAFPDPLQSPIQNYDLLMMQYPSEDGELKFWLDMEKKSGKSSAQQADEMRALGLRLSIALGYWITIYSADWWWTPNMVPAKPDFAWMFDTCVSQNRYHGLRIKKKLEEIQPWAMQLARHDPMPKLEYANRAVLWQISIDRLNLTEITGDVDLVIIAERQRKEKMKLFYPLDEGDFTVSQRFGVNPQAYPISKGHNGVDWAVPRGNNVYAMEDGEVIISEARKEKTGYGRQVRIQHPEGISIYGHLSQLMVKQGELVKGRQVIGLSGGTVEDPCSGNSSGAHLHAEYRLNAGAPQVPGGYVYNAIDIYPLLVSHSYGGEEAEPLFFVKTLIANLTVRRAPIVDGQAIRNCGLGDFAVYEERNGYGRINRFESEWMYLNNPNYVVVIVQPVPVPIPVPVPVVRKWVEMSTDQKLEKLRERVGGIE